MLDLFGGLVLTNSAFFVCRARLSAGMAGLWEAGVPEAGGNSLNVDALISIGPRATDHWDHLCNVTRKD